MTTMTLGTATAGRWVFIEKARGSGYTCRICRTNFTKGGWQFYEDGSFDARASVCGTCADGLLEEED